MPRWKQFDPDGGSYVLKADRDPPAEQKVAFRHRDPLPSEIARFEQSAGYVALGAAEITAGKNAGVRGRPRWISNGPTNSIKAALLFTVDVAGPGPDGEPLKFPSGGTDADKERFFARFSQEDLYEYAEHVLERRGGVDGDLRGN